MLSSRQRIHPVAALAVIVVLLASIGCRKHKYENPIAKDTQQPDKVLFDKAIADVERGRYEIATGIRRGRRSPQLYLQR